MKNNRLYGYFTVEATLIFPFVMGVILLVIYMFFYKYDRCLMEQDYAVVLADGMYRQGMDMEERAKYISDKIANIYRDEYWAWDEKPARISYDFRKINITGEGEIEFPFRGYKFWKGDNIWEAKRSYSGKYVKKMLGIRTFRKLTGLFT